MRGPLAGALAPALSVLLTVAAAGCGDETDAPPRCAECGMRADLDPKWMAGWNDGPPESRRFDTPKCLLRHLRRRGVGAPPDAWVVEYYSQERRSVMGVRFVVGSDLIGPMGRDLAPVTPEHVARFIEDHGGRELTFDQIDGPLLESIDG